MNWFCGSRLRSLFQRKRHSLPSPPERLGFIVGTGRCGTTILAQILNNHSCIVVPPELQFLHRLHGCDFKLLRGRDIASLIDESCPYHLERYFDYRAFLASLHYPQPDFATFLNGFFGAICEHFGKSVFLEQTPWHGQHLATLAASFPALNVIHVVRDPRDVVFSFMRTPYWGDIQFGEGLRRWENEVLAIREFGLTLGNCFIEVRYEDLLTTPLESLSLILSTLGLDMEETLLDPARLIDYRTFQKGAENSLAYQSRGYREWRETGRQQVFFKDNIYGWKRRQEYPALRGEIEAIAETLALYGYER